MVVFACIAGGLIVACTVFAILVPSGPEVTLSDVARRMEKMARSKPMTSAGVTRLKTVAKPERLGLFEGRTRAARQPDNAWTESISEKQATPPWRGFPAKQEHKTSQD
jgi:hypothetical protein